MHDVLIGKKILLVEGSLIASEELRDALHLAGATPFVAHNISAAFQLVERIRFDGVILDYGLHNEAFDLCTELQAADIPYVCCQAPHRLQGWDSRKRDAEHAVWKLAHVLSRPDAVEGMSIADYAPSSSQVRHGGDIQRALAGRCLAIRQRSIDWAKLKPSSPSVWTPSRKQGAPKVAQRAA